jgi:omega-3 fatty acid desaturase (delta-15 desaturase)
MKFLPRATVICLSLVYTATHTDAFAINSRVSTNKLRQNLRVATVGLEMPPIITEDNQEDGMAIPKLGTLARMIPKDSFDVDTKTSLFYFGLDFVACVASLGFLDLVVTSDFYHTLPLVAQALAVAPLQILSGFALWCMWCIGHDAGHTTVSNTNWINRVVGEISHSIFCLTPFVPWQKSHLKHHLNHNHLERDYSHQWFIREEADDLPIYYKWARETSKLQLPILYLVYLLLGIPDGGHVFFYGRMWEGESMKEKLGAAVSVAVSMTTALSLWMSMGTADFAVVIFAPWLVLSFWLFMVTYLQHHSDDGVLYTDDTWDFTKGAFETVDRDYGKWINRMSHHMVSQISSIFFSNRVSLCVA